MSCHWDSHCLIPEIHKHVPVLFFVVFVPWHFYHTLCLPLTQISYFQTIMCTLSCLIFLKAYQFPQTSLSLSFKVELLSIQIFILTVSSGLINTCFRLELLLKCNKCWCQLDNSSVLIVETEKTYKWAVISVYVNWNLGMTCFLLIDIKSLYIFSSGVC